MKLEKLLNESPALLDTTRYKSLPAKNVAVTPYNAKAKGDMARSPIQQVGFVVEDFTKKYFGFTTSDLITGSGNGGRSTKYFTTWGDAISKNNQLVQIKSTTTNYTCFGNLTGLDNAASNGRAYTYTVMIYDYKSKNLYKFGNISQEPFRKYLYDQAEKAKKAAATTTPATTTPATPVSPLGSGKNKARTLKIKTQDFFNDLLKKQKEFGCKVTSIPLANLMQSPKGKVVVEDMAKEYRGSVKEQHFDRFLDLNNFNKVERVNSKVEPALKKAENALKAVESKKFSSNPEEQKIYNDAKQKYDEVLSYYKSCRKAQQFDTSKDAYQRTPQDYNVHRRIDQIINNFEEIRKNAEIAKNKLRVDPKNKKIIKKNSQEILTRVEDNLSRFSNFQKMDEYNIKRKNKRDSKKRFEELRNRIK